MTVIGQDARLYAAELGRDETVQYKLGDQRHAWIQVARGNVGLNGLSLNEGDGAAVSEERELLFTGMDGEFLLFDLA